MIKRYPFSLQKHAHDIELMKNVAYNTMHDLQMQDSDKANKYEQIYRELSALLTAMLDNSRDGKVTFLTGKEIGKAKEMVFMANEYRMSKIKS